MSECINTRRITSTQIQAGRSAKGGWSRSTLTSWGVPWPPPKGWQEMLLSGQFQPDPWTKPVPLRKEIFQKGLKLNPTKPEVMLHGALLSAFQHHRASVMFQELIPPYIADFYIAPCNIVIEVDGSWHWTPAGIESDKRRDTFMTNKGIRVFRFTNDEVEKDAPGIAQRIFQLCGELPLKTEAVKITRCPPANALC